MATQTKWYIMIHYGWPTLAMDLAHFWSTVARDNAGDSGDACRTKKDRRLPGDHVGGLLIYYNLSLGRDWTRMVSTVVLRGECYSDGLVLGRTRGWRD